MISLEIAISNFKSLNYQEEPVSEITLKFGQISTTLILAGGQSGKCLYLDLSGDQLQDIYLNYACGLFIMNRSGKYFSLMSFQKLRIEDKVICNDISFFNDLRETKFTCQFSLVANNYKSPKLANTTKFQQRQKVLDLLKKPPIPKQTKKDNKTSQQINSFLYGKGNTNSNPDHLQTLKQDLRKKHQVKANLQKIRHGSQQLPKASLAKYNEYANEEDDPFENNPPMMQFTNQQVQSSQPLKVPQINYIQYQQSAERLNNKPRLPKQNNFLTFNKNETTKRPLQSAQTPPQFETSKGQSSKKQAPKRSSLSKQQIKQMAKQQAESSIKAKQNVMIPIARGGSFQLVPLSSLKPEQIIQYVQKQRKTQEKALNDQLRRKRLDQRQKQIEQKNRKLQQLALKRQQNLTNNKRLSKEIRTSIHKEQIKQQSNSEQQNEEDYADDFQSMSASNSIIRSRISSRGNTKNLSKEQQSVMQDEYSQDFDSYSHSMLSKTNLKNQAQSVSDYSQSYSISQSFRK